MELSLATAEHLRVPRLKSVPSPVISSDLPWDWTVSPASVGILCVKTSSVRMFITGDSLSPVLSGQCVSPVLSLVPVVPAITRSVLIKETIAQYSESDIGCAGLLGGEYTCTSAVSTTLMLIQF